MDNLVGFNVRVYAFCLSDDKILAIHENYAGTKICKLPGGGLELGEGTIECLHREFEEELNLKIEILRHHFTQDTYIESRIKDNKQILNIYYIVKILNFQDLNVRIPGVDKLEWIDINSNENPFVLLADRIAFEKLQEKI